MNNYIDELNRIKVRYDKYKEELVIANHEKDKIFEILKEKFKIESIEELQEKLSEMEESKKECSLKLQEMKIKIDELLRTLENLK